MPQLEWDEIDFLDCLEVFPEVDGYETKHVYKVRKNEVVLTVVVEQFDSYIRFFLQQRTDAEPLIQYGFFVRDGVDYINDKRGVYLEFKGCFFTQYHSPYLDYTVEQLAKDMGLRIQLGIKPQIQIRFV
jgi:hypothetical protein